MSEQVSQASIDAARMYEKLQVPTLFQEWALRLLDTVRVGPGSSVLDAFDRLEVLEATAEAVINAGAIGEVTPMPQHVIDELRVAFKLP